MLRVPLKQCYSKTIRAGKQGQLQVQRLQSTSSGSEKSNVGLYLGAATVAGLAGAAAYAKYDLSFRSKIEENIPYADQALNVIIGTKEHTAPPPTPVKVPVAKKVDQESLLKKKLEREKQESKSQELHSNVKGLSKPGESIISIPQPRPPSILASSVPSSSATSSILPEGASVPSSSTAPSSEGGLNPKSSASPRSKIPIDEKPSPKEETKDPKAELREQLKIQLSAYNDYLKEQLQLQENELARLHSVVLEETILEEKMRYQRELATSIERLREVERILQVREKLDREEESSRVLWLLCQRLNSSLKSNPKEGVASEPQLILKNLKETIDKLISDSSEGVNPLSKLALKSLPKNVVENGVYSEDALIQRFDKVDNLCKRVSLVDEEHSSLARYLLSYIQSMLIVDRSKISDQELRNEEVDATKFSTYDILARVRHHLRDRNLEMSLRYANQLKGEPRKVASDWIRDVRNHLEVRQVSSIVQAQSAAAALRTLNK